MKIVKLLSCFLVATLLLPAVSCKKKETPMAMADIFSVALSGETVSAEFARNPNPLYASNDIEYAIGSLIAPGLMQYDQENGWQSVLGTIALEDVNGKTVATITIDVDKSYSNGRKLSTKDYQMALKRISSIGYDGYYTDYHKNPIEGLLAYRYGVEGLTAELVPDFEEQADKKLSKMSRDEYKALLVSTSIASIYPENANPQSICPDGRTFKTFVVEETRKAEERLDTFFIGDGVRKRMLEALATIYSNEPKEKWLIEELRQPVIDDLEHSFAKEAQKNGERTAEISGVVLGNTKRLTVTFEKKVDHDLARKMLNIPMIYYQSQAPEVNMAGAGGYRAAGFHESTEGYIVNLSSKNYRALSVTVLKEEQLLPTLYMGQISAAPYNGTENQSALQKAYKIAFMKFGEQTVMYDPDVTDEKELKQISVLFS